MISWQEDPPSMICYGIGILPLLRMLQREFPAAKQPWFADDGSNAGKCAGIRAQFERLQLMALSVRKEDSSYELKFELHAARALIPSGVRDEPQVYPCRSADVEGRSTPPEERGDLQIKNLWNHQADCAYHES